MLRIRRLPPVIWCHMCTIWNTRKGRTSVLLFRSQDKGASLRPKKHGVRPHLTSLTKLHTALHQHLLNYNDVILLTMALASPALNSGRQLNLMWKEMTLVTRKNGETDIGSKGSASENLSHKDAADSSPPSPMVGSILVLSARQMKHSGRGTRRHLLQITDYSSGVSIMSGILQTIIRRQAVVPMTVPLLWLDFSISFNVFIINLTDYKNLHLSWSNIQNENKISNLPSQHTAVVLQVHYPPDH